MSGVGLVARTAIRRQWRSISVITLMIGLAGMVVLASAAGARRTASSLDRFSAYSKPSDLEINTGNATSEQISAFRREPKVAAAAELQQMNLLLPDGDFLPLAAAVDARFGTVVDRPRVLDGRLPRPSKPNELAIGETLANRLHVHVGDIATFDSYSKAQTALAIATNGDPGVPSGPVIHFRVVGVVRRPLDLGVRGGPGGVVVPTPAFLARYRDEVGSFSGGILRVRTRHGAADVSAVAKAAQRIFGSSPSFQFTGLAVETEGARDAIDVLTLALWLFAGVAAFAGVVAVGIVATRQIGSEQRDQEILSALGLTRRQRAVAAGALALPAAVGGGVLAVLGAALLSPLLPFGVARQAEIDPGFRFDWLVLGFGLLAIVAFVLVVAATAGMRVARSAGVRRSHAETVRPSVISRVAGRTGVAPSVTVGMRMALEPGQGASTVPVRSAFTGAVLGTAGIVAVLIFSFSLNTLAASPRLYGWSFDAQLLERSDSSTRRVCDLSNPAVTRDTKLSAVAVVCVLDVSVDGRPSVGYGYRSLRGSIDPTVVAGRAPRAANEVALGAATLDALGKHVGDSVRVREHAAAKRYLIVGRVAFPSPAGSDAQALADGAAFTGPGAARVVGPDWNGSTNFVVRFAPGVEAHLPRTARGYKLASGVGIAPSVPVEVERLRQIDQLPTILGVLLVLLATVAVGHAIVLAVRRRRRDLAVLRTLGFQRSQIRTTVACQASTYAVLSLLVGIPLGVAVGRLIWRAIAENLGVVPVFTLSALTLVILVVGTLLVLNLVGALAARSAIRMRPASVLRTE